jgi:hypothetical protein
MVRAILSRIGGRASALLANNRHRPPPTVLCQPLAMTSTHGARDRTGVRLRLVAEVLALRRRGRDDSGRAWLRPVRVDRADGQRVPAQCEHPARLREAARQRRSSSTHRSSSQPYAFGVSLMTVCSGILMYGRSACGRLWKYA